jgi:hypothetical protein
MMKEYDHVRQITGEPVRRWFYDDYFDLIVWFKPDGSTFGFELCYDKNGNEKSLRWRASGTFLHSNIDDGESRPFRQKSSPILVKDGQFDSIGIGEKFINASEALPETIRSLILKAIQMDEVMK